MKQSNGKVITFIKKNALYLILAGCVLAIGLSITFMLMYGQLHAGYMQIIVKSKIMNTKLQASKMKI